MQWLLPLRTLGRGTSGMATEPCSKVISKGPGWPLWDSSFPSGSGSLNSCRICWYSYASGSLCLQRETGEVKEWERGKQDSALMEVVNVPAQQFRDAHESWAELPPAKPVCWLQPTSSARESKEDTRVGEQRNCPFSGCVPQALLLIPSSAQGNHHQWHFLAWCSTQETALGSQGLAAAQRVDACLSKHGVFLTSKAEPAGQAGNPIYLHKLCSTSF